MGAISKNMLILVMFSICLVPLHAEESRKNRLPVGLTETGLSAYSFHRGYTNAPGLRASMYAGTSASRFMTGFKGRVGEGVAQRMVERSLVPELQGWQSITPARVGESGIDSLMMKTDARGNIRDALVLESKAFSSQPGNTNYGRQMSEQWQRKWLGDTARDYGRLRVGMDGASASTRVSPSAAPPDAKQILLANNRPALVWTEGGQTFYSVDGPDIPLRDLQRSVSNTEKYLLGLADGKIKARSNYFRYRVENNEFVMELLDVDLMTGRPVGSGRIIDRGAFNALRASSRRTMITVWRKEIQRLQPYATPSEIDAMIQKCKANPDFIRTIQHKPTPPLRMAAVGALRAGIIGGGIALAGDSAIQLLSTGYVDWKQTGRMVATGALAGIAGSTMSSMTTYLLTPSMTTKNLAVASAPRVFVSRMSGLMSGAAGMFGASAVFSYLPYFMGWTDIHSAHRSMATTSVAGTGLFFAAKGALFLAQQFGTAGTGVAIATLSGAAKASAGLAALGGGPLAASGGGMAAGASILATTQVVGVFIVAGVVAYEGWTYVTGNKNQKLLIDKEFEQRTGSIYQTF